MEDKKKSDIQEEECAFISEILAHLKCKTSKNQIFWDTFYRYTLILMVGSTIICGYVYFFKNSQLVSFKTLIGWTVATFWTILTRHWRKEANYYREKYYNSLSGMLEFMHFVSGVRDAAKNHDEQKFSELTKNTFDDIFKN